MSWIPDLRVLSGTGITLAVMEFKLHHGYFFAHPQDKKINIAGKKIELTLMQSSRV